MAHRFDFNVHAHPLPYSHRPVMGCELGSSNNGVVITHAVSFCVPLRLTESGYHIASIVTYMAPLLWESENISRVQVPQ